MFPQLLALCDGNPLVIDEYPSQSVEWTLLLLLTWANSWTYSSVACDLKRNSALMCSIVYDRISNRWSVRCFDHAYPIVPRFGVLCWGTVSTYRIAWYVDSDSHILHKISQTVFQSICMNEKIRIWPWIKTSNFDRKGSVVLLMVYDAGLRFKDITMIIWTDIDRDQQLI